MEKLNEVCIIHTIDDYAPALFLKEFFRWIGVSFFETVDYEDVKHGSDIISKDRNVFDLLIFINDGDNALKGKYDYMGLPSVSLKVQDVWGKNESDFWLSLIHI